MLPRTLAFDVNETLLDLRALDPLFEQLFGDAAARGHWFAQMLQLAFVGAITDRYVDFPTAQRAAMPMVAHRAGVEVPQDAAERVAAGMRSLPPHSDVADSLERLRHNGCRLAALSNSPLEVEREQLAYAGIDSHFDRLLSADEVRALKPSREAYEHAAGRLGVPTGELCLVAAHSWDVAGALAAGCRAVFVARPGQPLSPLEPQPDLVVADLAELADHLTS
jgi:2-haloacid dehalogenase